MHSLSVAAVHMTTHSVLKPSVNDGNLLSCSSGGQKSERPHQPKIKVLVFDL